MAKKNSKHALTDKPRKPVLNEELSAAIEALLTIEGVEGIGYRLQ